MATLARLFEWKNVVVVKPDTLIRWHRKGFRLFWRWEVSTQRTSARARRAQGADRRDEDRERQLGAKRESRMSSSSSSASECRPRTVRKYMPDRDDGGRYPGDSSQRWATFVRNHAKAIIAADFLTVVTARFQFLYVFVVMEVGTRKILHVNVTTHPTAEWTLQFREAIPCEHDYRFVIVDRGQKVL